MKAITKKIILSSALIIVGLVYNPILLAQVNFDAKVIEKSKKSVVTIHGQASLTAYEPITNSWSGTGFITNKVKGHVLTNAHLVGGPIIGTYQLFFHDGSCTDAKVLYYDPWLDYAFLQIDPKSIPKDATEMKFSIENPVMDQSIFIIGNNEGKSFAIHTGTITNLYAIGGSMPQHSILVSLNTKGGSSGSPVINQRGEAVALHYGGSTTFAMALHPAYLRYAIDCIEKGNPPIRRHIGVFTEIYSLSEAVKYRKFPTDQLQKYNKLFPKAMGHVIQVSRTLRGSPADGKLMEGDIIWEVNGRPICTDLSQMDLEMSNPKYNSVRLGIYRHGEFQELVLSLYNLDDHKITQMLSFGGALFFEVDDSFSEKTGIPAKTLTFCISQRSNTFNNVLPYLSNTLGRMSIIQVVAFDTTPVVNFKQLIQAIPIFIQQKYFTMAYINYLPYEPKFGNWSFNIGVDYKVADINYDENSPDPKLFIFDNEKMEWKSVPVG